MLSIMDKALQIAGIGIVGVFVFMALFYLLILALDKLLPSEGKKPEEGASRADSE